MRPLATDLTDGSADLPIMNAIPSESPWNRPKASPSFGPVPTQSVMHACAMLRGGMRGKSSQNSGETH